MDYLKYSSDEMFSSTELIRKSKMIFEKVSSKKIDKAVILRDGKPSFIMLDFKLYEKLMKQYMKLEAKNTKDESFEKEEVIQPEFKKSNTITPTPIENKDTTKLNKIDLQEVKELSEELSEQKLQDIIDDSISPIESEINIEELPLDENEDEIKELPIDIIDEKESEDEIQNNSIEDEESDDVIDENYEESLIEDESTENEEDSSDKESDTQDLKNDEEESSENQEKDEVLDEDIVKEIEEVNKEKESANIKKRKALEDFWG